MADTNKPEVRLDIDVIELVKLGITVTESIFMFINKVQQQYPGIDWNAILKDSLLAESESGAALERAKLRES